MKILLLDGGGVFGKIQESILQNVDLDKFDCFVGTSIGSCNAALYATGLPHSLGFYDLSMPKIFSRHWYRRLNPLICKYPDDGLNSVLQSTFKDIQLKDAKKPLFITAADLNQNALKVFSSVKDDDILLPMWETIRQATAAETYFPSWKGFADGGVFANNPSMVGVAAASKVLGVALEDMELLSIGTGTTISKGGQPSNIIAWGGWLIKSLLHGAADTMHEYFVNSLPVKKNVRLQFIRDPSWEMDNVKSMDEAIRDRADFIKKAAQIAQDF